MLLYNFMLIVLISNNNNFKTNERVKVILKDIAKEIYTVQDANIALNKTRTLIIKAVKEAEVIEESMEIEEIIITEENYGN
jgi:hypothetical protein